MHIMDRKIDIVVTRNEEFLILLFMRMMSSSILL